MLPKLLQGKRSVITGCRKGIGKAMLELFARNGSHVWACLRRPDDDFTRFITDLSHEVDVEITPVYFDLADPIQVKAGAVSILNSKQNIDVLVNNAGTIFTSLFQMTSMEKMKEIFDVNYFSPLLFTQYLVRQMTRQKSGSIINLSSSAAIEGNEGRIAYASAKAAWHASTKVMAREMALNQIRVNTIAPGLTQTDMMTESTSETALIETVKRLYLKRVGEPLEIANVALFLASDLSSYMTGQVLRVDGGM